MRPALLLMMMLSLPSCYQSHERLGGAIDGGAVVEDTGVVDTWVPGEFVPPDGVCTPPLEWRRDRSPGDSQVARDQARPVSALFEDCIVGEGCAYATIRVGDDGRVAGVDPDDSTDPECIEAALFGMCLPTLVDAGLQEVIACGV